jgi:hypothetical protein
MDGRRIVRHALGWIALAGLLVAPAVVLAQAARPQQPSAGVPPSTQVAPLRPQTGAPSASHGWERRNDWDRGHDHGTPGWGPGWRPYAGDGGHGWYDPYHPRYYPGYPHYPQSVWIPGQWIWNGWQWVWQPGYWYSY